MSEEQKFVYGVFWHGQQLVVGKISTKTAWGSRFASVPLCGYQSTAAEARLAYREQCRRKLEVAKAASKESMEAMFEVEEGVLPK